MVYIETIKNHKLGSFTESEDIAKDLGWTLTREESEIEQSDVDWAWYEKGFAPMKRRFLRKKWKIKQRQCLSSFAVMRIKPFSFAVQFFISAIFLNCGFHPLEAEASASC